MTRNETIALFLECEAQRREARAAALAEGKNEDEAGRIAHEAAKAHWNAWASLIISRKLALQKSGGWQIHPRIVEWAKEQTWSSWILLHTAVMQAWLRDSHADFSAVQFVWSSAVDYSNYSEPILYVCSKNVDFSDFIFPGDVNFSEAKFEIPVRFDNVDIHGNFWCDSTMFLQATSFRSAQFRNIAGFGRAKFHGHTWFHNAIFWSQARFDDACFMDFSAAHFDAARFRGKTAFTQALFSGYTRFRDAVFEAGCSFEAMRVTRAIDFDAGVFIGVPNFIQAHFEEPPRLDSILIRDLYVARGVSADGDREKSSTSREFIPAITNGGNLPARWRALKRLAIQGHDTERELEFHARELRSQRFAEHWPLPWWGKSAEVWKSVLSFWFGVFYGLFSNFGRSLIRPAAFWLAAIALGAVFYLSQSPPLVDARAKARAAGSYAATATLRTAADAWLGKRVPCYAGHEAPPKDKNGNTPLYVGALSGELQNGTDLANEAWHLAFRNAFIVLDGSGEAAHRSFGCLYGVEMYGGSTPMALVPSAVSTFSAVQKLFSALMIFLFGLALRNMLKMK